MSTKQAIQTNTNSTVSLPGVNTMLNTNFDLNSFFSDAITTEDFVQSIVASYDEERNTIETKELKTAAARAITVIRGFNLLTIADKLQDSEFKHQVLYAIMSVTKYWNFNVRTNSKNFVFTPVTIGNEDYQMGRKTRAMYYRDSLEYVITQAGHDASKALEVFDEGVNRVLSKFRLMTDTEINESKNLTDEAKTNQLKLRLVTPYTKSGVSLILTRNTVLMVLAKGAMINIGDNIQFTNKRERRFSISGKDMTNGVLEVLDRVVIHPSFIVDNNGRNETVYSSNPVEVDGILNKLFMIKLNKLSFDKLFTSTTKRKIVTINENGKLKDLEHPAAMIPGTYLESGFVSSSEAISGYIDEAKDVAGLAQFIRNPLNNDIVSVLSVENINKAVSRNDKLEKDTWLLGKEKCFVVLDATSFQNFNDFGPAPIIANEALIKRVGLSRITSRMANGGIKAVTNYHPSNANGPVIVSPAAFKGGLLAALMLVVFKKDVPLSDLARVQPEKIKLAIDFLESQATTIEFMGRELKGFFVDLDLNVSNAYFVEEWKYTGEDVDCNELKELLDRSEDIFEQGNKTPSALRDKVMSMVVADKNFSAVEYIHNLVAEGTVVAKKPTTRYTASLFSQIAQWHGIDKAEQLVDSLIKRLPKEEKASKKIAMTILRGEKNPTNLISSVTIEEVSNIVISVFAETQRLPLEDVDTYPISVFERLTDLLNQGKELITNKDTYFKVIFGNEEVILPANKMFYDHIDNREGSFLASGLMKDLLIAAKGCIEVTDKGMKFNSTSVTGEGMKLEATIQNRLFGKNLGYIETTGTYQIMLNKLGKPLHRDEVLMTELSLFNLEGTVGKLNSVKHPAYFKDASASFTVTKTSFGDSLIDFAFRKAAFMSTFTIMVTEDDVDGDARQFSNDGYNLPSFVGPAKEFNGTSFLNFIKDEQEGCKLINKTLNVKSTNMKEFHDALQGASSAKANIGMFTASKYKYEAILPSLVGKVFEGTDGNFYNVTDESVYMICNTLSRLVQTEAMDNVKQSDQSGFHKEFISVLAAPHKFTTALRVGPNDNVLDVRNDYVISLATRLDREILVDWNVPSDFGMTMAQALCQAALIIEAKGTKYMDVFSARFNAKRIEEVTTNLITKSCDNEYSLVGYDLTDSGDSSSMYAYVLNKFLGL